MSRLEPDEWQARSTGFRLAFEFLGRSFYHPPNAEWLAALSAQRLFEDWPVVGRDPATVEGLAELEEWSAAWEPEQAPAVVADHLGLFVGPDRLRAPPWESVHRSRTGLTFQEATLSVREAYSRFGLEVPKLHREPDDHVGLELAFVAHLWSLAEGAARDGELEELERVLSALRGFLTDHLLAWGPGFFASVRESAESAYYRGLASLGSGTLAEAARVLETRGAQASDG